MTREWRVQYQSVEAKRPPLSQDFTLYKVIEKIRG